MFICIPDRLLMFSDLFTIIPLHIILQKNRFVPLERYHVVLILFLIFLCQKYGMNFLRF